MSQETIRKHPHSYPRLQNKSSVVRQGYSHAMKWNMLSPEVAYTIVFVLLSELFIDGGVKTMRHRERISLPVVQSFLNILYFAVCTYSDKRLLDLLRQVDRVDTLMRSIYPRYNFLLKQRNWWLIFILTYQVYLYFDQTCEWKVENCFLPKNILSLIYLHVPFHSMVCLFCTLSWELRKRFQLLKSILEENSSSWNNSRFLEGCRIGHAALLRSSEIFCDCFGLRLCVHFLMMGIHMVTFYCFPCFFGNGCVLPSVVQGVAQQVVLISSVCFCASQLTEKNEDILDGLNLISLSEFSLECKEQIELFSSQLMVRPPRVTVLDLYNVDMSTVLSILSTILMYTIIAAQLADRLEPYLTT
ncbi:hypothetical protein J6590_057324 [Homalodisca vitripennis]|nr:hypothetical protein J6590_057324 [Homalodisca vitripennis]